MIRKPVFARVRPHAKIPTKKKADSGFDLYAQFTNKMVVLLPGEVKVFNTGFISRFSTKYTALFRERGSTGIINLQVRAGVVEGNYSGEYLIMLSNGNLYQKICLYNPTLSDEEIITEYFAKTGAMPRDKEKIKITKDDCGRRILAFCEEGVHYVYAFLYPQDKAIAQMIYVRKKDWIGKVITETKLLKMKTERGAGKLGSSGK